MIKKSDPQLLNEGEGLSFYDLWHHCKKAFLFLRSRYMLVFLIGLIGCTFGFLRSYLSKPVYIAKLSYVVEGQNSSGAGLGGLATQFGFNIGGGGSGSGVFSPNNLLDLMKSRILLEKVLLSTATINNQSKTLAEFYIDTEDLRKKKWYKSGAYPDTVLFPVNVDPSKFSLTQNQILESIISNIGANNLETKLKSKLSTINEMTFSSKNEDFSLIMLKRIVKELTDLYVQTKTQKSKSNVLLLQFQADSIRRELNQNIGVVAKIADETFNLNPALNSVKVPSSKKQIDLQANTVILGQLLQNLEMAKVTLMQETPLIQIIDEPRKPLSVIRVGLIKSIFIFGSLFIVLISVLLLTSRWMKSLVTKS